MLNKWEKIADIRKAEGRYHDILPLRGQGNLLFISKSQVENVKEFCKWMSVAMMHELLLISHEDSSEVYTKLNVANVMQGFSTTIFSSYNKK